MTATPEAISLAIAAAEAAADKMATDIVAIDVSEHVVLRRFDKGRGEAGRPDGR